MSWLLLLARLLAFSVLLVASSAEYSVRFAWAARPLLISPFVVASRNHRPAALRLHLTHRPIAHFPTYRGSYRPVIAKYVGIEGYDSMQNPEIFSATLRLEPA